MRAPNGGARPSFWTMRLSHGLPGTMIRVPEFVPPRRRFSYEPRLNPDVVFAEWQLQPPGDFCVSGRMSRANDTLTIGFESVHEPVIGIGVPASSTGCASVASGAWILPTSGS